MTRSILLSVLAGWLLLLPASLAQFETDKARLQLGHLFERDVAAKLEQNRRLFQYERRNVDPVAIDVLLRTPQNVVIEALLPIGPGLEVPVVLERSRVFAEGIQPVLMTEGGAVAFDLPEMAFYRGTVGGDPDSSIVVSVSKLGFFVEAELDGRHYRVQPFEDGDLFGVHRVFALEDLRPDHSPFPGRCASENLSLKQQTFHTEVETISKQAIRNKMTTVNIAVDVDTELLQAIGNQSHASTFVGNLISSVNGVYDGELGVALQVTALRIWSSGQPYTGQGVVTLLNQLGNEFPVCPPQAPGADVALLLSGKDTGSAQFAAGGNLGLVSQQQPARSVVIVEQGWRRYGWVKISDRIWVAHEVGHALGASHTHCGSSPADQCADPADGEACVEYSDRVCGPGTIMSYCYQCPGGLSNISLTFTNTNRGEVSQVLSDGAGDIGVNAPFIEEGILPPNLDDTEVLFTWCDDGASVQNFRVRVGSGPGQSQYFDSGNLPGTASQVLVTCLPTSGETLFFTLQYRIGGLWKSLSKQTNAVNGSAPVITAPADGSQLSGSTATLQWNPPNVQIIDRYHLDIGTSPGSSNLVNQTLASGATQFNFNLPAAGQTVYVQLRADTRIISPFPAARTTGTCAEYQVIQSVSRVKLERYYRWDPTYPKMRDHAYAASQTAANYLIANGYTLEPYDEGWVYATQQPNTVALYELLYLDFGENMRDSFYTTSTADRDFAISLGYTYRGVVGYVSPSSGSGRKPFYRTFSSDLFDHFYTTILSQRNDAINFYGYIDEGVEGYVWTTQQ